MVVNIRHCDIRCSGGIWCHSCGMEPEEQAKDEGDQALAMGDLGGAEACYRSSVTLKPDYAEGWHALGMVLLKRGMLEAAIQATNRAAELAPNDEMTWTSLSIMLARANRIHEAEAAVAKARIISWGGKIDGASKRPEGH